MDILVVLITAIATVVILNSIKIDKTSSQLMLLGIEITIVGTALMMIAFSFDSSLILFLVGLALIVIGLIVNLFGFGKK